MIYSLGIFFALYFLHYKRIPDLFVQSHPYSPQPSPPTEDHFCNSGNKVQDNSPTN